MMVIICIIIFIIIIVVIMEMMILVIIKTKTPLAKGPEIAGRAKPPHYPRIRHLHEDCARIVPLWAARYRYVKKNGHSHKLRLLRRLRYMHMHRPP